MERRRQLPGIAQQLGANPEPNWTILQPKPSHRAERSASGSRIYQELQRGEAPREARRPLRLGRSVGDSPTAGGVEALERN
eukprot:7233783-Alexandrium_andersonii.AAC.1